MPPQNKSGGPRLRKPKKQAKTEQENGDEDAAKQAPKDDKLRDKRKKVPVPYIGDIDDPNMDDFVMDNPWLLTGWRIGFHSYEKAASSFFMCHNESMNIWSHFLGACLMVLGAVYVIVYLQPSSLHDASLPMRWAANFDNGRFD